MKTLIVSDLHGNWPALQAVLAAESNIDQILCLGDLVNYGPQPTECVAWAMRLAPPNRVLQGNHDRAFGLDKSACAPSDKPLAEAMQAATSHFLTAEMKGFLADLQPAQEFCRGAARCAALHMALTQWRPSYGDQMNRKWPWESDIILRGHPDKLFVLVGHPDVLFLGGLHNPVKTRWATTLVVNPGSVGRPLDGDPRAAYAVWEDVEVTLRRVSYPVEETVQALAALKLDLELQNRLAEELRTGRRATPPAERTPHKNDNDTPRINSPERASGEAPKPGRRHEAACAN